MTIKEHLNLAQNYIIKLLDNNFVQYLSSDVRVLFEGVYPQPFEANLLSGTFNFKVVIIGKECDVYSDEFDRLTTGKIIFPREYIVKFNFLHNYCFNTFCNFLELMSYDIPTTYGNEYLEEFKFYLGLQTDTSNLIYNRSYKAYWRELLLNIIDVLSTNNHSFSLRFTPNQREDIINKLEAIEISLRPY